MHLGILSSAATCYSTSRLVTAARERGHSVTVIDPSRCSIDLEATFPAVRYKTKLVERLDAAIPRIGASATALGTAVLRQFEHLGVFLANGPTSIATSSDKLRSLQVLIGHSVRVPETAFVQDSCDLIPAIERMGGCPVVLRVREGSRLTGVVRVDSIELAESVAQTLQPDRHTVIVHRLEPAGTSGVVRALVVGDEVVAAMRTERPGGSVHSTQLNNSFQQAAVRAAEVIGLNIAGVDMLESSNGPLVIGVCSSPGLKQIEEATETDLAGRIINYIARRVDFSHVAPEPNLAARHGPVI